MEYLENIKRIRLSRDISQLEMSERLGLAQNNYGKIERGVTEMTVSRLFQIAEILKVPVLEIFGMNDHFHSLHLKIQQTEKELNDFKIEFEKVNAVIDDKISIIKLYRESIKDKDKIIEMYEEKYGKNTKE